jgi:acyl-CoA thioester hydrolase
VPSRFRFTRTMDVRFADMDSMGHVNNAVYLTYFEAARMAYWMHVTGRTDLKDMDMILARAEVDFRSPLVAPESVEIGVGCASIGRTSFVLEQDMYERKTGRLVAEARKVLVHYDYNLLRPIPIGEDLRRKILAQDPEAKQG